MTAGQIEPEAPVLTKAQHKLAQLERLEAECKATVEHLNELREAIVGLRNELTDLVKDENRLTPRQSQVIKLVRLGLQNKEIAAQLFITARTAKFHVQKLLQKYAVSNRSRL